MLAFLQMNTILLILLIGLGGVPVLAGEVAAPGGTSGEGRIESPRPGVHDRRNDLNLLELLRTLPGGTPKEDPEVEEMNRQYNSGQRDPNANKPYVPATGESAFANTAKECGEAKQKSCAPSVFGGKTMCGRAVGEMIKCMANTIGGKDGCQGGCGNGKDFVNCSNGQMEKCGYTKISPTDPRCNSAGAVLSYAQSETTRGKKFGHVEFVCGNNRFCSVYAQTQDHPWPRYPADACWFPGAKN